MRERFKRILCLVLSLTAAVGLMLVRDSAAWFNTQTGSALGQELTIQKMNFTFRGELNSYLEYPESGGGSSAFIISDKNLIDGYTENNTHYAKLSGRNFSTIATEVRFKILYTHPSTGVLTEYSGSGDLLSAVSSWSFDNSTHYFSHSFTTAASDTTNGDSFDLLTSLSFSDAALDAAGITSFRPSGSGAGKIIVAIQARQADNMIWADIGEIIATGANASAFLTSTTTTTQAQTP